MTGLPTSSTFSPTGTPPKTTDLPSADKYTEHESASSSDHESLNNALLLEPVKSASPMMTEQYAWSPSLGYSQDELDIISQPVRLHTPTPSTPEDSQSRLQNNAPNGYDVSGHANGFSEQHHQSLRNPKSLKSMITGASSPHRTSLLTNTRFSLPPSSPLHDTNSNAAVHRSMTASPTIPQSQHNQATNHEETTLVDAQYLQMAEDLDNSRRYSLRNRRPWQVNPYAYDKQHYKMQMRNNPEAIVKVVSPRRDHAHHGTDANNRYEEDEFVVPGDDAESQEVFTRKKRRSTSNQPSESIDAQMASSTKSVFPFPELSEDELSSPSTPGGKGKLGQTSSKSSGKIQEFPLKMARYRKRLNMYGDDVIDVQPPKPAISYTRKKVTMPQSSRLYRRT